MILFYMDNLQQALGFFYIEVHTRIGWIEFSS